MAFLDSDERICTETAKLWLESGGDSEGFIWCYNRILNKIRELEEEKKNG